VKNILPVFCPLFKHNPHPPILNSYRGEKVCRGWWESSIVTTQKYYLKSTDANKKKAVEGLQRLMGD
jgi:hypothetical protein